MVRRTRIPLRRHLTLRARRARRRITRPHGRESFFVLIEHRQRIWTELVRRHGDEREIFPEFDKLRARRLAQDAGVATPELLDGPVSARKLAIDEYGDEFVIKPNWGASGRGVLHLFRDGGGYRDVVNGSWFPDASAVRHAAEAAVTRSRRGSPMELLVEASVSSKTRPVDWKVYTFWGEIGLTLQLARGIGGTRGRVWSSEWTDLGPVRRDLRIDRTLPPPRHAHALLDAARRISKAVPTGFLRVDLYEREDDIVAGEVALLPGGDQYFGRKHDRRLARMWFDADIRILSTGSPLIP